MTGGVAHDFNNLFQIISGNLQLLQAEIAPGSKAERRITNAMAGVQRGAKLASQLLAFGIRQPLEPKVINVGRLVGGMEELLRRSIGEGIEMETVVSPTLWNAFENAVLNLPINARDAMDGMGKLTIRSAQMSTKPTAVRRSRRASAMRSKERKSGAKTARR